MSRSVEMGRAVLSAPTSHHELWLTTLITISPEQDPTYLAQLNPAQFLWALSSGAFWVGRGHEMHMDLRLTLQNEAFPLKQLQDLTYAVLGAPIWHQLMLSPVPSGDASIESGTVRLNISHATTLENVTRQKRHRLFPGVPAVDTRPPDGVVSFALQSVSLFMDILETSPRRGSKVKQPAPSTNEGQPFGSETEDINTHFFDTNSTEKARHQDKADYNAIAASRKRKRTAVDTTSAPLEPLYGTATSKMRRSRVLPESFLENSSPSAGSPPGALQKMVDLAIRLSVRGTLNKCPHSLKVKASTFRLGLADIAPALWRCGYLDALSHRAQLAPTIASSLIQSGFVRGTSISLKSKMGSLGTTAYGDPLGSIHQLGRTAEPSVSRLRSSIASQLWIHSQRTLFDNPVPPIQACVVPDPHYVNSDSEDMLAEGDDLHSHAMLETWDTAFALDDASDILDNGSASSLTTRDADEEILFDPPPLEVMLVIDSCGDGKPVSSSFGTGHYVSDAPDVQQPAPFRETQRVHDAFHPVGLASFFDPSAIKASTVALPK